MTAILCAKSAGRYTLKAKESSPPSSLAICWFRLSPPAVLRFHLTQRYTHIFSSLPRFTTAGFTLPTCTGAISSSRRFRPITSHGEVSTEYCALAPPIHGLRVFERQQGGRPVDWDHREFGDWLRGDSLTKTRLCYWPEVGGKRKEIARVLFRRNRVGNGEKEEEEEESRGRAAYVDNALCLREKK